MRKGAGTFFQPESHIRDDMRSSTERQHVLLTTQLANASVSILSFFRPFAASSSGILCSSLVASSPVRNSPVANGVSQREPQKSGEESRKSREPVAAHCFREAQHCQMPQISEQKHRQVPDKKNARRSPRPTINKAGSAQRLSALPAGLAYPATQLVDRQYDTVG